MKIEICSDDFLKQNIMGPNSIIILEELLENMNFENCNDHIYFDKA